jgi:RND superfamily putative drug exporter
VPGGWHRIVVVYPATGPQQTQTTDLVDRVRSSASRAADGTTLRIYIGGDTTFDQVFSQLLTAKMPQFVAVVVGLAFVLLALVIMGQKVTTQHVLGELDGRGVKFLTPARAARPRP